MQSISVCLFSNRGIHKQSNVTNTLVAVRWYPFQTDQMDMMSHVCRLTCGSSYYRNVITLALQIIIVMFQSTTQQHVMYTDILLRQHSRCIYTDTFMPHT